jgi:hypothetical protein
MKKEEAGKKKSKRRRKVRKYAKTYMPVRNEEGR